MIDLEKINNDFEQGMINRGYRIWRNNNDSAIRLFQKPFSDIYGIRYYLTCKHYNYYKQNVTVNIEHDYDRYSFSAQFEINDNTTENTIDISYYGDMIPNKHRDITSLDDIEIFFENMFLYLNAKHYELF